jgi:hypothetical protein
MMTKFLLVWLTQLWGMAFTLKVFISSKQTLSQSKAPRLFSATDLVAKDVRGKVLVSGIGAVEEDEFMLNLLNEQNAWDSIVLATNAVTATKKRFLSRSARYSGLLNILEFAEADVHSAASLAPLLSGTNAWLAFDVPQASVPALGQVALDAGVKRVLFTITMPPARVNNTYIPEFKETIENFQRAGAYFTGIRHGEVVEGDENNPYEIMNATQPLLEPTVERGVLARIAAELFRMRPSFQQECGVCSSSEFAAAYLNIMRSSGLNRQQEVYKVFTGGIQKMARLTVNRYEERRRFALSKEERVNAAKDAQQEQELSELPARQEGERAVPSISDHSDEDFESYRLSKLTEAQLIDERTEEVLQRTFVQFNSKLLLQTTTKRDFFDMNRDQARELAIAELAEEREERFAKARASQDSAQLMMDQLLREEEQQYAKLLMLERKEMLHQKDISDTWIRYMYLLLETAVQDREHAELLFSNRDEFQQTVMLRDVANRLRERCGLPPHDVIYDRWDAAQIVSRLGAQPGCERGPQRADELAASLKKKYGELLKSVPALRGAMEKVEKAIAALQEQLPASPLSPSSSPSLSGEEMRREEVAKKLQKAAEEKLEAALGRDQMPTPSRGNAAGKR